MHPAETIQQRTSRSTAWLLAVAYGVTIANLYYCQPLLPDMARSYASASSVATLPTYGQVGYLLGLVLVVPLGDIVRRRSLVFVLLCAEAAALVATGAAPSVGVLLAAGTVIGLASGSVVNTLVPHVAAVTADHERGRVTATVLSGGMAGILLSRTVAGAVAELVGWRALFLGAAAGTLALALLLARTMTAAPPDVVIGYGAQLRAVARLAVSQPVLRRRSMVGACTFASCCAFWATSAFLLAGPPYGYDEARIGLFGLVGGAGVLAARACGRLADRGWEGPATGALLAVGVVSYGAIWAGGADLAWFLTGLLLMNVAVTGVHLLNMSVVYGLARGATARIASVYMTFYTLGGVLGSAAGTAAYRVGGWGAVSAVGAGCMAVALGMWLRDNGSTTAHRGGTRGGT